MKMMKSKVQRNNYVQISISYPLALQHPVPNIPQKMRIVDILSAAQKGVTEAANGVRLMTAP